jgi:hypothetical protein
MMQQDTHHFAEMTQGPLRQPLTFVKYGSMANDQALIQRPEKTTKPSARTECEVRSRTCAGKLLDA